METENDEVNKMEQKSTNQQYQLIYWEFMPFVRFFQVKLGIGKGWEVKYGNKCAVTSTFTQEKVQECKIKDQLQA